MLGLPQPSVEQLSRPAPAKAVVELAAAVDGILEILAVTAW